MDITKNYSFLVKPGKNEKEQPTIENTEIPLSGDLYEMLSYIYKKSDRECNVEIVFTPSLTNSQNNLMRNHVTLFIKNPTKINAHIFAEQLQTVTTKRSGPGLLFALHGKDANNHYKFVICRFPTDIGIIANQEQGVLKVEMLKRVFMKSSVSYKAVVYEGNDFDIGFWNGHAVDKQISNRDKLSCYWIKDFLQSEFKTTSASGTRRLAKAIKQVMDNTTDTEVRAELGAAALLAPSLENDTISIENFGSRFCLSEKTKNELKETLSTPAFCFTTFSFSKDEFKKHIHFYSISIDNGAILTAPRSDFNQIIKKEELDTDEGVFEFKTHGKIINEQLKAKA